MLGPPNRPPSLRGAKRRSNPCRPKAADGLDRFAALAMTVAGRRGNVLTMTKNKRGTLASGAIAVKPHVDRPLPAAENSPHPDAPKRGVPIGRRLHPLWLLLEHALRALAGRIGASPQPRIRRPCRQGRARPPGSPARDHRLRRARHDRAAAWLLL